MLHATYRIALVLLAAVSAFTGCSLNRSTAAAAQLPSCGDAKFGQDCTVVRDQNLVRLQKVLFDDRVKGTTFLHDNIVESKWKNAEGSEYDLVVYQDQALELTVHEAKTDWTFNVKDYGLDGKINYANEINPQVIDGFQKEYSDGILESPTDDKDKDSLQSETDGYIKDVCVHFQIQYSKPTRDDKDS